MLATLGSVPAKLVLVGNVDPHANDASVHVMEYYQLMLLSRIVDVHLNVKEKLIKMSNK